MKKKNYIILAVAVAGLMLTACTQEDDFVAKNNVATEQAGEGAVLFDTYLSNANTRAGQTGTMTTSTLQNTGFGIFAFQHALAAADGTFPYGGYSSGSIPNYMYNQYVGYESSNWVYSPLKYWPNETASTINTLSNTDQQEAKASNTEGVSFFAYAPYVNNSATSPSVKEDSEIGITELSAASATTDPKVKYIIAQNPSNSVDLLWGVSSGFQYHPVATNVVVTEPAGLPVKNMMKPQLEEKIKFDFKHALARIGMTIVGAFDQLAQGGELDNATKVTVKEIKVRSTYNSPTTNTHPFAKQGTLNLNNSVADRANWEDINIDAAYSGGTYGTNQYTELIIDNSGEMNPNIKYGYGSIAAGAFPLVNGVLSTEQNVIVPADPWTDVTITSQTVEYNVLDGYYDKDTDKPVVAANLEFETTTEDGYLTTTDGITYKYSTTGSLTDISATGYAADAPTVLSTKPASDGGTVWYFKKSGDDYDKITYSDIEKVTGDWPTTTYYTVPKTAFTTVLKKYYKATTYKFVKKNAGYFMVIPTTTPNSPENVVVNVQITYYVTTKDNQLDTGTSEIENVISQDVTLEKFTNGKSYNLKLILGLTSVKVDAEVSNWEVGTVESNLPQNLE